MPTNNSSGPPAVAPVPVAGATDPSADADRERRAMLVVVQEEMERAQTALTGARDEAARLTADHARLRTEIEMLARQLQAAQSEGALPAGVEATLGSLVQSYHVLGRSLEYHMGLVNELRAEWDRDRRFALAARVILTDLTGSRMYRLMRLCGRWGSLERKIARAFRM